MESYCSWCYRKTEHSLEIRRYVARNTYKCQGCGNYTLECRYCKNMTKGRPSESTLKSIEMASIKEDYYDVLIESVNGGLRNSWDNELCAEHDGTIASFERLDEKLDCLANYNRLYRCDSIDVIDLAKNAGAVLLGVATKAVPAGMAVRLGVSGIALASTLTKSSNAMNLVGSICGTYKDIKDFDYTIHWGVTAKSLLSEGLTFRISEHKRCAESSSTIYINGFTQENEINFRDWKTGHNGFGLNGSIFTLNWSSSSINSIFNKIDDFYNKGFNYNSIVKNSWYQSMVNAKKTGFLLADAISRIEGGGFNLVGHSLGCRVIFYALKALATKDNKFINDVILLGGAVGKDSVDEWRDVLSAVGGVLYNCYSAQDEVLSKAYRFASANTSHPIGISPIDIKDNNLVNVDCSDLVEKHTLWKDNYLEILRRVYGS